MIDQGELNSETPSPGSANDALAPAGGASTGETPSGQPAVTPAQAAPVAAPPAATQHAGVVPIEVLLRTRDEGKAAKQRAELAERRLAEIDRQRREAVAQAPNPLDDPEGFSSWVQNLVGNTKRQVVQEFQGRSVQQRTDLSREIMEDQLGEKFGELAKFIDDAPDDLHHQALQQNHPYRWFYREFLKAEKAKKAEAVTAKLGDKSLEDIVAEAVAAERAKWEAANGGGQTDPATGQPRAPDGKFASPSQPQQRRAAPSLAAVNGAQVSGNSGSASGYDALFKRG